MSEQNDQLYTMSFYSSTGEINENKIKEVLTNNLGVEKYGLNTKVLLAKSTLKNVEEWQQQDYIVLPYNEFENILKLMVMKKN